MTDVLLQQKLGDGGEISFDSVGNIQLTDTVETSVYNSLFGGGSWWADISEADSNEHLTGEMGQLVKTIPPSSSNLILIEDAGKRDLQWMLNIGAASSVEVSASLANIDQLTIVVDIEYDGKQVNLTFSLNWTN